MVDVSRWLADQGLGHCAEAFAKSGIAGDILRELTDADLKELGLNLGDRKRLLKAIAALPAAAPAQAEAVARPGPRVVARDAERRQLTVLFCDLVGSTALSARLDPEDMSAVMRAYRESCAEVVRRWDGHVAKYMGDGVLAYFGWPQAHEDDAERAVRAGLELAAAVGRLKPGDDTPLAARVGIATGLVMVGELIGEGAAREEAVVGDTPNLAARLQALAEPGAVVVAASTRRLLGGLFELTDLGPTRLKGFSEPLAAFRVEGEGRAESRFDALHGQRLTPLVGREQELAILLERWAWAKDGDGQVVLLAGEPGIGKSRLLRALRQELSGEPHLGLSHFCSPYHTNSALYPIIAQLERAAGFAADDVPEAKLAKLETLLRQAMNRLDEAAPLISALLGVPSGARYPALNLSPQRQKQRTLEVLIEQLAGLARDRPVVELYEDVHWVDPSTLELLDLLVERVRALPVLAVLTYRPEFSPPWTGHAHVTSLPLNRLGRRQGAAMVERVMGGKALPAEVLEQIVARTDGVPLFVEELTKTVLESGLLTDTGDRYELTGPLPPLAIPATLQDSLMARLDRLAPVKEVAQTAAVIGREFSHELIVAVSPLPEADLDTALDQLVASELVFRRGAPPDASYSFKHALVQDAAYGTLLKSKRQHLHARIVQVLEEQFPEAVQMQPELLAYHCTEAGLAGRAIDYWHKAGQRAIGRSAMAEAVAQLRMGLELLQGLPSGLDRDRREFHLQTSLGMALNPLKGQAAAETGQAYGRAHELCRRVGETEQLFPVLFGQWTFHATRAAHAAALATAEELLRLADGQNDSGPLLIGHRIVGTSALHVGRLLAARAHLERTLSLHDPGRHRSLAFLYTNHPRPTAPSWLSWVLFALGYPDQALARHNEGLVEARKLAHPNTLAQVLFCACMFSQWRHDQEEVGEHAKASILLATEQGFPTWLAMATILQGWWLVQVGETERAITQMDRGLSAYRATSAELWIPYFSGLLAEAHGKAGQPAEGLRLLDEALARVERTGERWCTAELNRFRGELLLSVTNPDQGAAEAALHQSITVAREQEAKFWELRASTNLARLWRDQGKHVQAVDLLAPVYDWFTEGFDTADLKDAKALLDELT
jgi:class 3 adenylate cyclase/predicted ATPase